jgi:hypothetical protein
MKILPPTGSFIRDEYRRTSHGHAPIDGMQFHSYKTGIQRYAWISEDGKIKVARAGAMYHAEVIDHGGVLNASGKTKFFRTQEAAAREAVKIRRAIIESAGAS